MAIILLFSLLAIHSSQSLDIVLTVLVRLLLTSATPICGNALLSFGIQSQSPFFSFHLSTTGCYYPGRLPVPRSFRQEAANLGLEIVADEYILGVDSVPNVPNLEEVQ